MNLAGLSILPGGIVGFVCALQRQTGDRTMACGACELGPRLKRDALHVTHLQTAPWLTPLTGGD
jgi:hypothetical protein